MPAPRKDPRAPLPLKPRGDRQPPVAFRRGAHEPYAIRWFGSTALVGHLRHLGAEALASEQLDTRDWMRPQQPGELLDEVARVLDAGGEGDTLLERLGRDVWIDFAADTADDYDVSAAVAGMVFSEYTVDDGETGRLPRGDLLIFGGDTAYPLSSAREIARRLIRPWNRVLRRLGDPDRARVMLGIPGNHDWYDGLDGFARIFRRDPLRDRAALAEGADTMRRGPGKDAAGATGAAVGRLYRQLHLDELVGSVSLAQDALASTFAVIAGRKVKRASRLWLLGYRAVQEASYWLLPLAPGLDLWGVDRQLRSLDFRQRLFFNARRAGGAARRRLIVAPDPVTAMGEPNAPGLDILKACNLSLARDETFYLTGDSHHYERRVVGPSMHVIAGGGGAFTHGTRVHRYPAGGEPACAFPDQHASRRLAASVPIQTMLGTAGILPHLGCAALAALEIAAFGAGRLWGWGVTALVAACVTFVMFQAVAKRRERPWASLAVALAHGPALALAPIAIAALLTRVTGTVTTDLVDVAVMAMAGPLIIGYFLLSLVLSGLEHHQAFAVLGHPGFKHFVRMRIGRDGRIRAWVIGKDDTLGDDSPAIVDQFSW
jgi:hypothetical protein